jgi:hypothetical protein
VLDGDDLWLPSYVELVVGRLEADPDVAIVSPEVLVAVEEEMTDSRYYGDGYPLQWFDTDQLEHLCEMNFIVPLSTYRRTIVESVGEYDPTPGVHEDWDLWLRAIGAGFRAGHISEPCGVYRFRTGSITSDRVQLIKGRIAILERLAATDGALAGRAVALLSVQQLQLLIAEGKEALHIGDLSMARSAFARAARHRAGSLRERAGSLAVAAFPRAGQAVLSRRTTARTTPLSVQEIRKARE